MVSLAHGRRALAFLMDVANANAKAPMPPARTKQVASVRPGDAPKEQQFEVEFRAIRDLGMDLAMDADGRVIVSALRRVQGQAERLCPRLRQGDVLVAIDEEPVADLAFADIMAVVRKSAATRPTSFTFLRANLETTAPQAVSEWRQRHDGDFQRCDGEFDVEFESAQPTGLQLTTGYMMTGLLKLAHMDDVLSAAIEAAICTGSGDLQYAELAGSILVRVNDDAVVGAPVEEVTDLLRDISTFPVALWLQHPDQQADQYSVLTLAHPDQLQHIRFDPIEMMLEVPVVSRAAWVPRASGTVISPSAKHYVRRRDGIKAQQYVMAVNGVSTLRINGKPESIVDDITDCLQQTLCRPRVLRLRDLREYRREFEAKQPLSAWRRRQREQIAARNIESTALARHRGHTLPNPPTHERRGSLVASEHGHAVFIERKSLDFTQLVQAECDTLENRALQVSRDIRPRRYSLFRECDGSVVKQQQCEGRRRAESVHVPGEELHLVIHDEHAPIGIQLETDVLNGLTVFKSFCSIPGPAMDSRSIRCGDQLVSVNGEPIEATTMDALARILDGHASSTPLSSPTANLRLGFARRVDRARSSRLSRFWR